MCIRMEVQYSYGRAHTHRVRLTLTHIPEGEGCTERANIKQLRERKREFLHGYGSLN